MGFLEGCLEFSVRGICATTTDAECNLGSIRCRPLNRRMSLHLAQDLMGFASFEVLGF